MILAQLLLLAGCTGGAGDSACEEGQSCCAAALPTLSVCVVDLPAGESVSGVFTSWASISSSFTSDSGEVYDVWVEGDGLADVPDMAAAGPVTLTQTGNCDGESGIHTALHVAGATGDTLLLVGARAVTGLGSWTVAVRTTSACDPHAGDMCNELLTDRPLDFMHEADGFLSGVHLDMGMQTTLDAYTLRVNLSQTGSGDYLCSDGGGTDYTNFWITGPG